MCYFIKIIYNKQNEQHIAYIRSNTYMIDIYSVAYNVYYIYSYGSSAYSLDSTCVVGRRNIIDHSVYIAYSLHILIYIDTRTYNNRGLVEV